MIHYEKYDQKVRTLISTYTLGGRISRYESSVDGHESFEIDKWITDKNHTCLYEHEGEIA
jgi:hypothetical protein